MTLLLIILTFLSAGFQPDTTDTAASENVISVIRIDGSISPTTTNYIERGIEEARANNSQCLIIELDTPGGLLQSTQDIVQTFFETKDLPIVVYVSPEGASATSAGTFITLAAHVAAMAPATSIGSASPVQMVPGGGVTEPDTVMQNKLFGYTRSFIEGIAEKRGRNKEWALAAVQEGVSITETEAVDSNVVDIVAEDRVDLLQQLHQWETDGMTIESNDARIVEIPTNLAENFLGFIMRPEVMMILTLIAIYGIIGEISNPGAIVPGTAGVIALILLLYASAAMPINVAGFALILLAIALFIAEAFTPAFGLLVAGGAVSFFLGLLMLFQDMPESMELSWGYIIPATALTTLFFLWIVFYGLKAQTTPTSTGIEGMIGKQAEVLETVNERKGRVFINGEYWNAVSDQPIKKGEGCQVIGFEGLVLKVKPVHSTAPESKKV